MNNINLIGRIATDLNLESIPSGAFVIHFTVAVKRPHVKDKTDFIRCVAWRGTAEFIEKWFSKGRMIALNGSLTSNSWKTDDGKNRTTYEVLVDSVEFCGDKSKDSGFGLEAVEQAFGVKPVEVYADEDIPF